MLIGAAVDGSLWISADIHTYIHAQGTDHSAACVCVILIGCNEHNKRLSSRWGTVHQRHGRQVNE